jgi:shikimate dehydrogenase
MKRAGVMGWPVEHSRSPLLHRFWLRRYGIAGDYVLLPVRPDELAGALRGLRDRGFVGCNITLPHKQSAAELVNELTPRAAEAGAVNTIQLICEILGNDVVCSRIRSHTC